MCHLWGSCLLFTVDLKVWALPEPCLRSSDIPFLHAKDRLRIGIMLGVRRFPDKLGFNASLGCYHRSEFSESPPLSFLQQHTFSH